MASLSTYTFISPLLVIFYQFLIDKNETINQAIFVIIIIYSFSIFHNFTMTFQALISFQLTHVYALYFILHVSWYLLIIFIDAHFISLAALFDFHISLLKICIASIQLEKSVNFLFSSLFFEKLLGEAIKNIGLNLSIFSKPI